MTNLSNLTGVGGGVKMECTHAEKNIKYSHERYRKVMILLIFHRKDLCEENHDTRVRNFVSNFGTIPNFSNLFICGPYSYWQAGGSSSTEKTFLFSLNSVRYFLTHRCLFRTLQSTRDDLFCSLHLLIVPHQLELSVTYIFFTFSAKQ